MFDVLLLLLRVALGHEKPSHLKIDNWDELYEMAYVQGVISIACDGLQKLYGDNCLDGRISYDLLSAMMEEELDYVKQENAIHSLASFYIERGIKMMVLKGLGLSWDYPVPQHRYCCDVDIYLFGEQEKADKLIESELGIMVDNSHHIHSVFSYQDVTIENHYQFFNEYSHRSSKEVNNILKKLALESKRSGDVWFPSPEFNALHVLRHAACHFAAQGISLRNVLDWGLFVEKHFDEVDWDKHWELCVELNMHLFLLALNEICVEYLGFSKGYFKLGGDKVLTQQVLDNIKRAEFNERSPRGIISYIVFRYRKWKSNSWKHHLVYREGLKTTFIYQVIAHLMKPATLKKRNS